MKTTRNDYLAFSGIVVTGLKDLDKSSDPTDAPKVKNFYNKLIDDINKFYVKQSDVIQARSTLVNPESSGDHGAYPKENLLKGKMWHSSEPIAKDNWWKASLSNGQQTVVSVLIKNRVDCC